MCPDERITAEMGLYDNDPTFLKCDFQKALKHFHESPKYRFKELVEFGGAYHRFNFVPGTVELQVFERVGYGVTNPREEQLEESMYHHNRQKESYNMTVMLHPYQEEEMKDVHWLRALAIAKEDIAKWAVAEKIPMCFPDSVGWDYLEPIKDFSRIVYFPD
jgi:hypothetical protein